MKHKKGRPSASTLAARLPGALGNSKGGQIRMKEMTADERFEIQSAGGQAGGPARAAALTPKRRRDIARARWNRSQA